MRPLINPTPPVHAYPTNGMDFNALFVFMILIASYLMIGRKRNNEVFSGVVAQFNKILSKILVGNNDLFLFDQWR